MQTAKTLIRLGGHPGWSESSLGTRAILLVLSWGGSYYCRGNYTCWNFRCPKFSNIYGNKNINDIWAASWQNQQNDCGPSKDSDQPGHPSSLISVFFYCLKKAWVLSYPLSAQRRLGSAWASSEDSDQTGHTVILLVFSRGSSFCTYSSIGEVCSPLYHCDQNLLETLYIWNKIQYLFQWPHDKTNKMTVRPAKTQISLDIWPVWSESSLCALNE